MTQQLHAGPLSLRYENGEVRTLKFGEIEVIRRIHGAVRDCDWGTVPIQLLDENIVDGGDHFQITFRARHQQQPIHFEWQGEITGGSDGSITFSFDGEAKTKFWRSRIGLSVLHPLRECINTPVQIEHTDGRVESTIFPEQITPHCPFQNLKSLSHQIAPDLWAKVSFEGDTFETEDQRNWADASFKTYCTPLELPYPVQVEAGTKVTQRVSFEFLGQPTLSSSKETENTSLAMQIAAIPCGTMPLLGLCIASEDAAITPREAEYLRQLNLSHLRVELWLNESDWQGKLQRANIEARAIGCQLEMAVFTREYPDFTPLVTQLEELRPSIKSFLLFEDNVRPVSNEVLQIARQHLRTIYPNVPIGVGTNANYAELNRNPPPAADFVVFSANPQVHAFDDFSLMETPEALAHLVKSACLKVPSNGVAISPLTLKPRFNAVATSDGREISYDELPANVDVRQAGVIYATWTLSAIAALASGGLGNREFDSLTLCETTGWRGVIQGESEPKNKSFPAEPGQVFPVWYLLKTLADFRGRPVYPIVLGDSGQTSGLAYVDGWKRHILIANTAELPVEIEWDAASREVKLQILKQCHSHCSWDARETHLNQNGVFRFQLAPYTLASICS